MSKGADSLAATENMLPCPSCGEDDVDATFAMGGDGQVSAGCMICGMCGPTSNTARDAADRWNALPRPREAVERDAARYKWLRDKSLGQFVHPIVVTQKREDRGMQYLGPLCLEALDAAIDAAMSSQSDTNSEGKP